MQIMPTDEAARTIAVEVIKAGGLVVFPTDTVYGVGCDPYNVDAIRRVYAAKGRATEKALPLLLAGYQHIGAVASSVPQSASALASAFWPGALTLVVPRAEALPPELGGGPTIAVRVPNNAYVRGLIEDTGGALAATSANASGQPDALDVQQAVRYLGEYIELAIDGGPAPGGVPSTVVDCTCDPVVVLRTGAISPDEIYATLAQLESS